MTIEFTAIRWTKMLTGKSFWYTVDVSSRKYLVNSKPVHSTKGQILYLWSINEMRHECKVIQQNDRDYRKPQKKNPANKSRKLWGLKKIWLIYTPMEYFAILFWKGIKEGNVKPLKIGARV